MHNQHTDFAKWVAIVSGVMLLLALGKWQYSYYQTLRVVVFFSSCYLSWYFLSLKIDWLGWVFIASAIVFNPFMPIYLAKGVWQTIDVISAALFLYALNVHQHIKQR